MWWSLKHSVFVTFSFEEFEKMKKYLEDQGIECDFKHDHIDEPFKYWHDKGEPWEPDDDNFKDIYEIRVWRRDQDRALELVRVERNKILENR